MLFSRRSAYSCCLPVILEVCASAPILASQFATSLDGAGKGRGAFGIEAVAFRRGCHGPLLFLGGS
jgi:hypothetical protein